MTEDGTGDRTGRRRVLAALSGAALGPGLAGCAMDGGTSEDDGDRNGSTDGPREDGSDGTDTGTGTEGNGTDDEQRDPDPPAADSLVIEGPTVGLTELATGMTNPTDMVDPGADALLVTDQTGEVWLVDGDGRRAEPFLDLRDRIVELGVEWLGGDADERGLIGIALHPDYDRNRRLFVRYSAPPDPAYDVEHTHVEVLAEFAASGDGERGLPASEERLLEVPQPNELHNSGNIVFGPEGYLYVAFGDGGARFPNDDYDPWYDVEARYSQDTRLNLIGGIHRIDVDAGDPYAIPDTNPLADAEGHRGEYYAWGFRHPWGMSFDGDDLYAGEVGDALYESVNRIERGGNYGWPLREGTHCMDLATPAEEPASCPDGTPPDVRGGEEFRDPILEYPHVHDDAAVGTAVVGGHVYRGSAVPALQGEYVFGDWSQRGHGEPAGRLFVASAPEGAEPIHEYHRERGLWQPRELAVTHDGDAAADGDLATYVSAIGRDRDGELYLLASRESVPQGDTGALYRIGGA